MFGCTPSGARTATGNDAQHCALPTPVKPITDGENRPHITAVNSVTQPPLRVTTTRNPTSSDDKRVSWGLALVTGKAPGCPAVHGGEEWRYLCRVSCTSAHTEVRSRKEDSPPTRGGDVGFWEISNTCARATPRDPAADRCPGTRFCGRPARPSGAHRRRGRVATHSEGAGDPRRAACQRSRNRKPRTVETLDLST